MESAPMRANWRPSDVKIGESEHTPPKAHLVPILVEEMCDYVNENWGKHLQYIWRPT